MPVSTRSQKLSSQPENDEEQRRKHQLQEQEEDIAARNPHQGLKEKMKALTLLYEQQQKRGAAPPPPRFSTQHPTLDALSGDDFKDKENEEAIVGLSCPNNVSTKLLSSSVVPLTEPPPPITRQTRVQASEAIVDDHKTRAAAAAGLGRILVFVRLRPMAKKETEAGSNCCVRIMNHNNNKSDVYLTQVSTDNNDYLRLKRLRGRHFTFDASFPDSTTQQQVYSKTTAELVEAVLGGRNGSVFCYGATGAGKTYTMLGTVENPGVMVLAIKDLFNKIRQRSFNGNHLIHLSYLEVYNETVRDLLSPGRPLVLREDKQGIVAAGLSHYRAYSSDEVMALLQQGNKNRMTEPTRANETSSRSHAILQVVIEYQVKDGSSNNNNNNNNNIVKRVGKLSLIDLAGSERAIATDQRTLRSLEGANINKSLLALSSCINGLVEGKKHIPYRNSKLTQLLKDSLGGDCTTVMIANISPSSLSFSETQNTLHWADRAKQIRIKACDVNVEMQIPDCGTDQAKLLLELQKENRELRMELARQQQKLLTVQAQQTLAATTPSTASSLLSPAPPPSYEKRKARSSFLTGGSCFTPESKGKAAAAVANETLVRRQLSKTVKTLEAEIERINKDHALQIKKRDSIIRELSGKVVELGGGGEDRTRAEATARLRRKAGGELKSPSHRFLSPAPTAKKRSYWDITTANSPSVVTLTGRKTRSQFITGPAAAPSMLLQLDTTTTYRHHRHHHLPPPPPPPPR
ncbi:hypothetical protein BUALT_Bualt02G0078700 [Buddleja alternifolia]|uniref:Kinesin-like protein n=1 Tax=Buddleja alternifolia TaxID=168488 RepID=A0AAV6Y6Y2_9LAMI|nr:hypothetical protein BUALT_Bualt02G0078700 [Buddleja alternifolia]